MTTPKSFRMRGFTLVELTVVLAIVGILMALLFPALAESRQQAQSRQCQNHLKQLGLAMWNYHDTHKTFPPGWVQHHPHAGSGPGYGWQSLLLPFVDQAVLYDQIDFHHPFQGETRIQEKDEEHSAQSLFRTPIAEYRCPTDPTPDQNKYREGYATSNYSGNFGNQPLPRWSNQRSLTHWPGKPPTPTFATGMFWLNSKCRAADITDGMSNTFMVGERSSTSGAGIWVGVNSNEFENDQVTDCSFRSPLNGSPASFSSHHPKGAYFLFGDGSVHFINQNIETATQPGKWGTFQLLSHREDGMVVPEF